MARNNEEIAAEIAKKSKLPKRRLADALRLYRKILKRELLSTGTLWIPALGRIKLRRERRRVGNNKRATAFKIASFRLSKGMK